MMMIKMLRHRNKLHPNRRGPCALDHFVVRKSFPGTACVGYLSAHCPAQMCHDSPTTANCCPDRPPCCWDWIGPFCPNSKHHSNMENYLAYLIRWLCHSGDTLNDPFSVHYSHKSFSIVRASCRATLNRFQRTWDASTNRVTTYATSMYSTPWDSNPAARDAAHTSEQSEKRNRNKSIGTFNMNFFANLSSVFETY